jgi:hypothetical protein
MDVNTIIFLASTSSYIVCKGFPVLARNIISNDINSNKSHYSIQWPGNLKHNVRLAWFQPVPKSVL